MGVGHVPAEPLRGAREGAHLQGRQRGGAPEEGVGGRRRALGAAGEATAARWYEAAGYEVVDRNWRCREGELDLVLRRGRTVVFCEVKTRSSDAYGVPAEAVTREKRARIRHLAAKWLDDCPFRPLGIRFDVASVTPAGVEVIEGAF